MSHLVPATPGSPPAIVDAGGAVCTVVTGESDAGPSAEAAGQEGQSRVLGLPGRHVGVLGDHEEMCVSRDGVGAGAIGLDGAPTIEATEACR